MTEVDLPYGTRTLVCRIRDEWLGAVVCPQPPQPAADAPGLITESLDNPIGSARPELLAKPGQRVAIIVDDCTRQTPIPLLLPPILDRLKVAGAARQDIRIVVALGTCRPMNQPE